LKFYSFLYPYKVIQHLRIHSCISVNRQPILPAVRATRAGNFPARSRRERVVLDNPAFHLQHFIYSISFIGVRVNFLPHDIVYAISTTKFSYYFLVILSRYPMAKADNTKVMWMSRYHMILSFAIF